jgi:hypothetical protein
MENTIMTMVSVRPFLLEFVTCALAVAVPIAACGGNTAFGTGTGGTPGAGNHGLIGTAGGSGSGSGTSGSGTGSGSGTSSGSGTAGSSGPGATATCVAGTQGCLCDSTGGCAPNLTCTPQGSSQPSVCCGGSNCAPASGSIGATCGTVTGTASCTPGITIPSASGNNDNCGYPASSFVESTTICTINAVGGGSQPAVIQVFYNDEHALTLGCDTSTYPVSPLTSDPGSASYPQTGDPACVDAVGRPLRPVLYVTDTTADPTCTAGDLQQGGQPYDPVAVFGTWKSATEGTGNVGTPATMDPTANKWNLGPGADALPTAAVPIAGTPAAGMPAVGMPPPGMPAGGMPPPSMACGEGYGAELRFEVGLISGHSYRFQVILHDGDQNKGGDSGEACATYCAGGPVCDKGVQMCGVGPSTEGSFCPEGTKCINYCCLGPPTTTPPPPGSSSPPDSGPTL